MAHYGLRGGWQSRIEKCEEIEPPRRQDRQGGRRERGHCGRSARFLGLSSANSWRPWRLGGSIAAIRSGHHPAIHREPEKFTKDSPSSYLGTKIVPGRGAEGDRLAVED